MLDTMIAREKSDTPKRAVAKNLLLGYLKSPGEIRAPAYDRSFLHTTLTRGEYLSQRLAETLQG